MTTPTEIVFKNMDRSDYVETRVHEEVEKLEKFFDHISSIRVVVEAPHNRRQHGDLYRVAVHLNVPPGNSIDIDRTGPKDHGHEDVYVAVRDSFKAATRKLQDYKRKLAGEVKAHEEPLHGKVLRLVADQGFGFLSASDGREIYFHRNSVSGDGFDKLEVGSEVRIALVEGEGEKGPQASSVVPIGKHHIAG